MNFSVHKINDWISERPWPLFWRSLPALLAGLLLLATLAMVGAQTSGKNGLRQRYQRVAISALNSRNYEFARVACLRGLAFASDDQARLLWLFYLSIALNGLGHPAEAAGMLATAAPPDHPGCGPAHLAVARSLLGSTNLTPAMILQAEKHLKYALELDPQSPEIKEMLGRFYINTRDFAKARAPLLDIYPLKNDVALLLAIIENANHNSAETRTWADAAIDAFKKNLRESGQPDSQADRFGLVRALLMADDFDEAINTLEAGLAIQKEPAYHAAIADICALRTEKIPPDQTGGAAERLRLIQKGLTHSPQHLKLRLMLIEAALASNDSAPAAKKLLDGLVAGADKESAARWHFLLWTELRIHDDLTSARHHLQTAYELDPQVPVVRNDLAMDLAGGSPEDMNRALKLIQSVVEQCPDNPGFRDTRGRVLARLGRNENAAADLEFAAARLANPAEARMALAKVYDALGKKQLAEQQRRLAINAGKPE